MAKSMLNTAPPQMIRPEEAHRVRGRLVDLGYSERGLAERLGRNAFGLPNLFEYRWRELRPVPSAIDPLIGLLLMGEETELSELVGLLDEDHTRALEEMRLIEVSGSSAKSHLKLFPCRGLLVATDNERPNPGINRVTCLYQDAYVMAHILDSSPVDRALDLCTGSGIYGLVAARRSKTVLGVDVNERAVAFSRFNAGFNRLDNIEFETGNLYEPVAGSTFDLILANPPFNPDPDTPAGDRFPSSPGTADYFSGGRSGEEVMARIIEGLDQYLSERGVCHIVTLLAHPRQGPDLTERISTWLGGRLSEFDVLIWAIPYDHFERFEEDPAKLSFLREHFDRFEFGTVSIRRRSGKEPIYYHGPPPGFSLPLFDEDCRLKIRIDDQAFLSSVAA